MAKILVIDDSLSAVQKVKDVLKTDGHEVVGLDLIIHLSKLVKDEPPDVIMLDLSMPALSGINVASFVRKWERRPIPIIVYSSRSRDELIQVARDIGAAGWIKKGNSDDDLRRTVRSAIMRATASG